MKAKELMAKSQTVDQKVDFYFTSVSRDLERIVIDTLVAKLEKIEDEIFNLEDFSLNTDINSGKTAMTRAEVQAVFQKLISLRYEQTLLTLELAAKKVIFDSYFGEEEINIQA